MQLTPSSVSCFVLLYLTSFWDNFFLLLLLLQNLCSLALIMAMAVGHVNGRYGRNLNIACAVDADMNTDRIRRVTVSCMLGIRCSSMRRRRSRRRDYRWGSTCDCRHIKHKIVCQTRMRNGKTAKKYGWQAGERGRGWCSSSSSSSKTLHYNLCACKPRSLPLNPCLITRNECAAGDGETRRRCSLYQARQGRVDSQARVGAFRMALSTLWASVWGKQFSKICLNSLRLRWKFMLCVCVCIV